MLTEPELAVVAVLGNARNGTQLFAAGTSATIGPDRVEVEYVRLLRIVEGTGARARAGKARFPQLWPLGPFTLVGLPTTLAVDEPLDYVRITFQECKQPRGGLNWPLELPVRPVVAPCRPLYAVKMPLGRIALYEDRIWVIYDPAGRVPRENMVMNEPVRRQ